MKEIMDFVGFPKMVSNQCITEQFVRVFCLELV